MTLSPELVTTISRDVAGQIDDRIEVVSVASQGGSDRVELLLTRLECEREPCVVMVNVNRADAAHLKDELEEKLHDAFATPGKP